MSDAGSDSQDLLKRLIEVESQYASHHRVAYERETLKAIAFLAKTLPYVREDEYETALDLLDEVGAEIRANELVGNKESAVVSIDLRKLAPVVARRTGRSLDDFIQ